MRNSSVEIFRIISTLFVLIVHFNGWFVGIPDHFDGFSLQSVSQAFIEALSCIGVNCFLVISGWYGVKFKWTHVWTIYSILVWIYVPFYIVEAHIQHHFTIQGFLWSLFAVGKAGYYVLCYLMLMFLSPILNTFIKKYRSKIIPYAMAFWGIEIVFDWILGISSLGFGYGYMLTHFVLMYLLGQSAFLYQNKIKYWITSVRGLGIYLLGAFVIMCMYFFLPFQVSFAYSNPINVIMSFALFFVFERHTYYNDIINWVGKSTLAVYILHITPPIINILKNWDNYVLDEYSYSFYLMVMLVSITLFFIMAILYDKIRMMFMPIIGKIICSKLSKYTSKYSL